MYHVNGRQSWVRTLESLRMRSGSSRFLALPPLPSRLSRAVTVNLFERGNEATARWLLSTANFTAFRGAGWGTKTGLLSYCSVYDTIYRMTTLTSSIS